MVAWLIDFGTTAFGHGEFGVRIFAFLCHLVTVSSSSDYCALL